VTLNTFLRKPEISQLDVTIAANEHVLRLQVTIEHVHGVKLLESEQNVCRVEPGSVLLKSANLTKVEEQFTAWAILQAEEEFVLRLERVVHLHNEWIIHVFLHKHKHHGKLSQQKQVGDLPGFCARP
jgi:hypothetical protein